VPDLSKRPARYITFLVAATMAGGYVITQYGVRVGDDPNLTQLRSENAELRQQAASIVDQPPARSGLTCASFPDQQAAQAYWVSHRTEYPDWDGNHNDLVCEQLKSAATPTASKAGDGGVLGAPVRSPENPPTAGRGAPGVATKTETRVETRTVVVPARSDGHVDNPKPPRQEIPKEPATKPTAPTKTQILSSGKNFGLYTATEEEFSSVQSTVGRTASIEGYFQGWDTAFRPARVNDAWSKGRLPLLTWETRSLNGGADSDYSLAKIQAGAFDHFLHTYAKAIVANGLPMAIRLDHEMNGDWYPWSEMKGGADSPRGSYIASWKRVHDIFQQEGANNLVLWVWAPNRTDALNAGFAPIDNYFPGAAYVDYVGMSGYYRKADTRPDFDRTYGATLAELARVAPGKPVLLAEVGATAANPQHKVDFVNAFFAGLAAHPEIRGFIWFNYAVTDTTGVTNDWRINLNTAVKNAFQAGLATVSGYGAPYGKKPTW
jgi:mannan endo-1,4-beta-mannosidase